MSEALQQLIRQAEAQKIQMEMNLLYNKNLNVFEQRLPAIHKLASKHTPANFVLRLDTNGKLNLFDQQQRQFLYNDNPEELCQKQVAHFQKTSTVRKFRVSKNKEYNERHLHIKHLNQLIDAYEENQAPRIEGTPEFLSTLIVSGVGLGYHLLELIENFDIHNIVIYENCIDSFHASLHVIDWQRILDYFGDENRSISLCIGVKPRLALAQIESTVHKLGIHSQVFTFVYRHSMRKAELEFIETYQKELRSFIGGLGYYDDEQIGLAHAYHNLKSDSAVFISKRTHVRKPRLLLIGNGPSLDFHQEYIERNRDNAIIMSCGSALGSLLRIGIKPDFHVEMERCVLVNDFIKHGIEESALEDITLLCLHSVAPETIKTFSKSCYAIKPNDAGGPLVFNYYQPQRANELIYSNPTVANCGLAFAVSMGFIDIHLIGVDLGVPESGEHHSQHSVYRDMEKHAEKEKREISFFNEDSAILNEGNFGGQIKASPVLNMSRIAMERYLSLVKPAFPQLKCINSNKGALISGVESKPLEDVQDCEAYDKLKEIKEIKSDHFYYKTHETDEATTKLQHLKYFYSTHEKLKLSEDIHDDKALCIEMHRAYSIAAKEKDPTTHFLLRGTINSFFGSIVENTLYCTDKEDFEKNLKIGIKHYNDLIDKIYQRMHEEPFKLDETFSPILRDMKKVNK